MPVPLFLAETNHTNRVENKSILADVLTEKVKCLEWQLSENQKMQMRYVNTVLRKGPGYQRIDVLFDGRHSIKATTRSRRSENTAQPVRRVIEVREVQLPIKWQAFMALGDNKADFAQIISDELILQAPADSRDNSRKK
ncbi:hypothetical protein ACROYT_G033259 [Oculina patagonica]